MTNEARATNGTVEGSRHGGFNPRVVLLLIGLLALICASVIATDTLSRRDRQVAPTTTTRNQS